jgi:hypothetical protein
VTVSLFEASFMALSALLSTLEGPASLSFIPDGKLDSQLAPLIQEGLRDGHTACVLQSQLQAFGWEPDRGFVKGRPDLRALASRLRHQCHEVCPFEIAFWRIFSRSEHDRVRLPRDLPTMLPMRIASPPRLSSNEVPASVPAGWGGKAEMHADLALRSEKSCAARFRPRPLMAGQPANSTVHEQCVSLSSNLAE